MISQKQTINGQGEIACSKQTKLLAPDGKVMLAMAPDRAKDCENGGLKKAVESMIWSNALCRTLQDISLLRCTPFTFLRALHLAITDIHHIASSWCQSPKFHPRAGIALILVLLSSKAYEHLLQGRLCKGVFHNVQGCHVGLHL